MISAVLPASLMHFLTNHRLLAMVSSQTVQGNHIQKCSKYSISISHALHAWWEFQMDWFNVKCFVTEFLDIQSHGKLCVWINHCEWYYYYFINDHSSKGSLHSPYISYIFTDMSCAYMQILSISSLHDRTYTLVLSWPGWSKDRYFQNILNFCDDLKA